MKLYELLTVMNDACPLMLDCTRTERCIQCPSVGAVVELSIPEVTKLMQMEIFDVGLCQNKKTGDNMVYITLLGDIGFFCKALSEDAPGPDVIIHAHY